LIALEHIDQPGKVPEGPAQPVNPVADDCLDPAGLEIANEPLQRRSLQRAATVATVIVAVIDGNPALVALTPDVGEASLALGVQRIEGLI
jgi:hypothetical protein